MAPCRHALRKTARRQPRQPAHPRRPRQPAAGRRLRHGVHLDRGSRRQPDRRGRHRCEPHRAGLLRHAAPVRRIARGRRQRPALSRQGPRRRRTRHAARAALHRGRRGLGRRRHRPRDRTACRAGPRTSARPGVGQARPVPLLQHRRLPRHAQARAGGAAARGRRALRARHGGLRLRAVPPDARGRGERTPRHRHVPQGAVGAPCAGARDAHRGPARRRAGVHAERERHLDRPQLVHGHAQLVAHGAVPHRPGSRCRRARGVRRAMPGAW